MAFTHYKILMMATVKDYLKKQVSKWLSTNKGPFITRSPYSLFKITFVIMENLHLYELSELTIVYTEKNICNL